MQSMARASSAGFEPTNAFIIRSLRSATGTKQQRAAMQRLDDVPAADERVLTATGRYIVEGFDDARLDTLFLAMPIACSTWGACIDCVQPSGRSSSTTMEMKPCRCLSG